MRLVFDTNVLIAAFISRGVCNELLEYCVVNHDVVLSQFIFSELKEKLERKFKFSARETNDVIDLLVSRVEVVPISDLDSPVSRDSDDDNIIATAIAGSCRCIVTGDKDLLDLGKFKEVDILAPGQFWQFEQSASS